MLQSTIQDIQTLDSLHRFSGRIASLEGLRLEVTGPAQALTIGAIARLGDPVCGAKAELVGFCGHRGILLACDPLERVCPGTQVHFCPSQQYARPCHGWLGRTIGAFSEPRDGGPPLPHGAKPMPLTPPPLEASIRARISEPLDLGIKVLDVFTPCAAGQRLGLFAGSGIGKSTLLSMLARHGTADIVVIGMIGERGREIREFIEDTLGADGLARAIVVSATSDESAPRRRRAARLTLTIAEYFRDQGLNVLCLLDSVTRFAHAQREIGLAAGEPSIARGYTPSVLTELPKLLERAGPGIPSNPQTKAGTVTGFFTVLVEGDDHDEPITDAVRGILDGHVVMSRRIAERERHPAIDPLRSLSRLETRLHSPEQNQTVARAKRLLSLYDDMEELIRVGAYNKGSDPELDQAVALMPELTRFMAQKADTHVHRDEAFAQLSALLAHNPPVQATQALPQQSQQALTDK